MYVNKLIVNAVLKQLGDSFTIGQLVDNISKEVTNSSKLLFYHPNIMSDDTVMRLSIVKLNINEFILTCDEHIFAIERNILRMIKEEIYADDIDKVTEDDLSNINTCVQSYLDVDVCIYDAENAVEQTIYAIMNSEMFSNLRFELRQNWTKTPLQEISRFYRGHFFKAENEEALEEVEYAFEEMNIMMYLEILGSY